MIPGKDPECTHNAVISGGSMWESWFPGGGSPDPIPANCRYPATDQEAIECMECGAKWLWSFEEGSQPDPDHHCFEKNEPEITKEATCTEDGLQTQTCLFCGDIETVIKGGHKQPEDKDQIIVTEPGCQDGKIQYTCETCGEEVEEILPGHHTFEKGKTNGVCSQCGAVSYRVYTYEDGATPSGSGYEIQLCARVMAEPDGSIHGVDRDGRPLEDTGFTVIINEALMGKVKPRKDENGNIIMTRVAGYRNMDDEEGTIYEIGAEIPYEAVPDLFKGAGSWGEYYSEYNYKAIYLEAVREDVADGFEAAGVPYDPAPSASNPELRQELAGTSEGITTELVYNDSHTTCTITYTIPAGYEGETIVINGSRDVMEAYASIENTRFGYNGTQPGDTLGPVFIRVVNRSGKTFSYEDGSFVLQSPDHAGETPYLDEIHTFDGVNPPEGSVPSRVSNGALKYLYQTEADLGYEELQDEVLGEKLRQKGAASGAYQNGVADLHQYYLDYYNHFYGPEYNTTWSNLSQVPYRLLVQRDEGIFGGQSSTAGLKETNPEVAGVGYSYMYTRLFSALMGDQENLKDPNSI